MNLNIIGNGFDLYHGLPSSYFYFGSYLIENNPSLYDELSEMYGFRKGIYSGFPCDDFYYAVEDFFWREFESHLGELNSLWVQETLIDDLDLEYDDAIDLEMYQYNNANDIKKALSDWMNDIVDKKENYNIIQEKMKIGKFKLRLSKRDFYISFNYTHALEEIYKVDDDNVLHIHGEATEEDSLVIGHGNDAGINDIKKDLEKYEEESYDQASRNRENELKCMLHNLKELRKDVDWYMKRCNVFLGEMPCKPEKVQVYGLSMGTVDLPYLVSIRQKWPDVKWRFSYYSKSEIDKIKSIAENDLGLLKGQYKLFYFNNSYWEDIQEEIVELQKIERYEKILG